MESLHKFSILHHGTSIGILSDELLSLSLNFIQLYCAWHKLGYSFQADYRFHLNTLSLIRPYSNDFLSTHDELVKLSDFLHQTEVNSLRVSYQSKKIPGHFGYIWARFCDIILQIPSNIKNEISSILHKRRVAEIQFALANSSSSDHNIHNFTDSIFSSDVQSVLNKGPNFIPSHRLDSTIHKKQFKSDILNSVCEDLHVPSCTNFTDLNNCIASTPTGISLPVLTVLDNLSDSLNSFTVDHELQNVQYTTLDQISALANDDKIIINVADKNLGFCINSTRWYSQEYDRQLSNALVYTPIYLNCEQIKINAISELRQIATIHKDILGPNNAKFLTSRPLKDIIIPSMNLFPKVHKLTNIPSIHNEQHLTARPIINGFSAMNVEPSKLLDNLLSKILFDLELLCTQLGLPSTIVPNSQFIIDDLQYLVLSLDDTLDHWLISFDFESLYTNIPRSLLTDTLIKLQPFLNLSDDLILMITELSDFLAAHAFFHVGFTDIFLQREGLAMGGYESVSVANLVLRTAELCIFSDHRFDDYIIRFFRYIDDGLCIVKGNFPCVVDIMQQIFTLYPPCIPITCNINKLHMDFLDISLSFGHSTINYGLLEFCIYQKPFCIFSYPHFTSFHPLHVKTGIIIGECQRYKLKSCNELEYNYIIQLFKLRLTKCGYPHKVIELNIKKYNSASATPVLPRNNDYYNITTFDNRTRNDLSAKKIFRHFSSQNNKGSLRFASRCQKKLKTYLLTKKTLHLKLQQHRSLSALP